MTRRTGHPAISSLAMRRCGPDCRCFKRLLPIAQRMNRRLCEAKYKAVVDDVVGRFLNAPVANKGTPP